MKKLLALSVVFFLAGVGFFASTRLMPMSDEELIRQFTIRYYEKDSWNRMSWLGVKTLQNPPDTWVIQELITELRPDFIIDSGTYCGGSALYMATVLEGLGLTGTKIFTIDVEPHTEEAVKNPLWSKYVEAFVSSSTDPKLVAQLKERTAGKKVLVLLDSLHTRAHVADELEAYAPFVPVGSYIVVQDTNINGHPVEPQFGEGPWEAVHAFLPKHPEFEIDKKREKFLLTFTPDGYLRRVK